MASSQKDEARQAWTITLSQDQPGHGTVGQMPDRNFCSYSLVYPRKDAFTSLPLPKTLGRNTESTSELLHMLKQFGKTYSSHFLSLRTDFLGKAVSGFAFSQLYG